MCGRCVKCSPHLCWVVQGTPPISLPSSSRSSPSNPPFVTSRSLWSLLTCVHRQRTPSATWETQMGTVQLWPSCPPELGPPVQWWAFYHVCTTIAELPLSVQTRHLTQLKAFEKFQINLQLAAVQSPFITISHVHELCNVNSMLTRHVSIK